MRALILTSQISTRCVPERYRPNLQPGQTWMIFAASHQPWVFWTIVWYHALAIGYSPAYLKKNADGIRQDWPRIPLPKAKDALIASAILGRQVAALLDTEAPVSGVTAGKIREELKGITVFQRLDGKPAKPESGDLDLTAG
jgi:hypothetical protein